MSKYIRINGHKLPVNMTDMAFLDRLMKANEAMQAAMAAAAADFPGDDPQAQYKRIEACVNATVKFFDEAFGDGTSEKVFRRTNEAEVYLKAVQDFTQGLAKLEKAFCNRVKHYGTLKFDTGLKRG